MHRVRRQAAVEHRRGVLAECQRQVLSADGNVSLRRSGDDRPAASRQREGRRGEHVAQFVPVSPGGGREGERRRAVENAAVRREHKGWLKQRNVVRCGRTLRGLPV
jgi:hypothetical protein